MKEAIEALERAREHIHYAPLLQQIDSALSLLRAGQGEIERLRGALHRLVTYTAQFDLGNKEGGVEAVVDNIIVAIDRLRAGQVEGWVLVPKEPTEEMERAGADNDQACETHQIASRVAKVASVYRAMLAAAPPPPQEETAR